MKNTTIIINGILEAVKAGVMAPDKAAKVIEELTANTAGSIVVNGNNVIIGDNNVQKVSKCRKHRGARKPKKANTVEDVPKAEPAVSAAPSRNPWLNKPQYKCDYLLACRSMHIGNQIVSVAALKDNRSGKVMVKNFTLPAMSEFVLAPYIHVIKGAKLSDASICLDIFNMRNMDLLQDICGAAISKGLKVFGVTKSLKEDDSEIVASMKKELMSLSATAKDVLDGACNVKSEPNEKPAEAEEKEAPKVPENTVDVVEGLMDIPKQKAHAGVRAPKTEEAIESKTEEGQDLNTAIQDEPENPDEYQVGIPVADV